MTKTYRVIFYMHAPEKRSTVSVFFSTAQINKGYLYAENDMNVGISDVMTYHIPERQLHRTRPSSLDHHHTRTTRRYKIQWNT